MEILNRDLRRRILEKAREEKNGHSSSALSCVDCIKYLYDNVLVEGVDEFILSKGHGEMALFTVLESMGKKPTWTKHLNLNEAEGIYATTGSLGHGFPIGVGRAFAKKLKKEPGRIYVLTGDGEMQEGTNDEAQRMARKLKLDNIVLLIDWNKYQAIGPVKEIYNEDDSTLSRELEARDWKVLKINGHSLDELAKLKSLEKGLNAVILDTIKGKGVRLLEDNHNHGYNWHKHLDEYAIAMEELK